MDVLMLAQPGARGGLLVESLALAATLVRPPGHAAAARAEPVSDVTVKAALLYNFVKFAE